MLWVYFGSFRHDVLVTVRGLVVYGIHRKSSYQTYHCKLVFVVYIVLNAYSFIIACFTPAGLNALPNTGYLSEVESGDALYDFQVRAGSTIVSVEVFAEA